MTIDELMELLDRRSETPHQESKAGFEWIKDCRDHQLGLIRDMMAMANTRDGGVIVLGVENATYKLLGLSSSVLASLDQSGIGQMLNAYAEPPVSFELQKLAVRGLDIAVIHIPEFKDIPIVCVGSAHGRDPKKPILRRGALYIRTEAAQSEEISSQEDMRRLLSLAVLKRKEDMLHSIKQLMDVRPAVPTDNSEYQFKQELDEADHWFENVLKKEFLTSPRWEIVARPVQYRKDRTIELQEIKEFVRSSQVHLRGLPFPYIDYGKAKMFNSGYSCHVDEPKQREGFRLYKSGLFVWKGSMTEDLDNRMAPDGKRTLDIFVTIFRSTEIFQFLKRLYEIFPGMERLTIVVRLTGCRGHMLTSSDSLTPMDPGMDSAENIIEREETLQEVELEATADELARATSRHIFEVFNWTHISEGFLGAYQNKLYGRVGQQRSS